MALFVISGVSAAGKSTVARLLAARFARGVCVHGNEIIGDVLQDFLALVPVPEFHLVFLDPDAAAIERRERERNQLAYGPGRWSVGGLQAILRAETDRIGLWLDTTRQSAEQTVEAILGGLDASLVRVPVTAS